MLNKKFLLEHLGHRLTVARYGDPNTIDDVCVECEDCNEIIYSWEAHNQEGDGKWIKQIMQYGEH